MISEARENAMLWRVPLVGALLMSAFWMVWHLVTQKNIPVFIKVDWHFYASVQLPFAISALWDILTVSLLLCIAVILFSYYSNLSNKFHKDNYLVSAVLGFPSGLMIGLMPLIAYITEAPSLLKVAIYMILWVGFIVSLMVGVISGIKYALTFTASLSFSFGILLCFVTGLTISMIISLILTLIFWSIIILLYGGLKFFIFVIYVIINSNPIEVVRNWIAVGWNWIMASNK